MNETQRTFAGRACRLQLVTACATLAANDLIVGTCPTADRARR